MFHEAIVFSLSGTPIEHDEAEMALS